MDKISKYLNLVRNWCNENSGFLTAIGFILTIVIGVVGPKKIAFIMLLGISCFGLWIFLKHKGTRVNKIVIYTISLLSFLILVGFFIASLLIGKVPILDVVKGYKIVLDENLEGGNFENNFIILDDQFASTKNSSKTLKVSSYKERAYTVFSNLKELKGDKILLGKFKINGPNRVGFRLMNTKNYDSDEILEDHFNECVLSSYDNGKIKEGYSHYVYLRGVDNRSSFQKTDINEGIYYLALKLSGRQISCYYQREGDENYKEIIVNQDIVFENLGGPTMTRYIDDSSSFPELLEFKIYSNSNE